MPKLVVLNYLDMAEVVSKKECGSQALYYIHFEDCKS